MEYGGQDEESDGGTWSRVRIRQENEKDHSNVESLLRQAFGGEVEVELVRRLRQNPHFIPELSLVAEEREKIVGYILFSPIVISTDKGHVKGLSLAPLAVHPDCQGGGIGFNLVLYGIMECSRRDHNFLIVIGDGEFYSKFGFEPARKRGLEVTFEVPSENFMAMGLKPGALRGISGTVIYPKEFDEVT